MAKSQFLQKNRSFHFGRSLARQMRIGSYWYSATVRRIMIGGDGGRICLFCDLNCDEDLGHLFFTCPAWIEDHLAIQSNIGKAGVDMESWNGLLADTKAHILLGSTLDRSDVDIDMSIACYDSLDEIALAFYRICREEEH